MLVQVHKAVAAVAEGDDLDLDPALAACVQLGLAGPHLVPPQEPLLTAGFIALKPGLGVPGAALGVGAVCLALALFSVLSLDETFGRDLDFVEE